MLKKILAPIAAALALLAALALPAEANLTATVRTAVLAHYTGSNAIGSQVFDLPFAADVSLTSGTGSYQGDLIYAGERTISASSNETLDLYGGLTDAFGTTLNFAKIKVVYVFALAANTNSVVVGNGTNPFVAGLSATTTTFTIPPGGALMFTAPVSGWAVTNSSNDALKVANSSSGTSVTYDIVVIGTSA